MIIVMYFKKIAYALFGASLFIYGSVLLAGPATSAIKYVNNKNGMSLYVLPDLHLPSPKGKSRQLLKNFAKKGYLIVEDLQQLGELDTTETLKGIVDEINSESGQDNIVRVQNCDWRRDIFPYLAQALDASSFTSGQGESYRRCLSQLLKKKIVSDVMQEKKVGDLTAVLRQYVQLYEKDSFDRSQNSEIETLCNQLDKSAELGLTEFLLQHDYSRNVLFYNVLERYTRELVERNALSQIEAIIASQQTSSPRNETKKIYVALGAEHAARLDGLLRNNGWDCAVDNIDDSQACPTPTSKGKRPRVGNEYEDPSTPLKKTSESRNGSESRNPFTTPLPIGRQSSYPKSSGSSLRKRRLDQSEKTKATMVAALNCFKALPQSPAQAFDDCIKSYGIGMIFGPKGSTPKIKEIQESLKAFQNAQDRWVQDSILPIYNAGQFDEKCLWDTYPETPLGNSSPMIESSTPWFTGSPAIGMSTPLQQTPSQAFSHMGLFTPAGLIDDGAGTPKRALNSRSRLFPLTTPGVAPRVPLPSSLLVPFSSKKALYDPELIMPVPGIKKGEELNGEVTISNNSSEDHLDHLSQDDDRDFGTPSRPCTPPNSQTKLAPWKSPERPSAFFSPSKS